MPSVSIPASVQSKSNSFLAKDAVVPPARGNAPWKPYERFLFRVAFIFFIVLSLPNRVAWYKEVLGFNWLRLNYRDLYDISRFGSGINWFGNTIFGSNLIGYAGWVITLIVAIIGSVIWTVIVRIGKRERGEYNQLYYWLRVIVRYRAGIGIIGFGFTKLFPVQLPYPSLGILNTNFGDLTLQKIYWLSIGIAPWYEVFAGIVEVAAGTLLFFRKTTTLGAIALLGALGDITYVNLSYDGGVHVYASYFVLYAAFLLVQDVPRFYNLLIKERVTIPSNTFPKVWPLWLKYTRIVLKTATICIFLVLLFWLQYVNFRYDPYKQPAIAGLKDLRGNYLVTDFRINNEEIPYSPLDSVRWQQATFEDWSTLTFKVNKPTPLDLSNGGGDPQRDIDRTFELTGVAGGQRVFHYDADTVDRVLYLEDKYKPFSAFRKQQGNARGKRSGRGIGNSSDTAGFNRAYRGGRKEMAGNGTQAPGRRHRSDNNRQRGRDVNWRSPEALAHMGNELTQINPLAGSARRDKAFAIHPKNERRKRMVLHYETPDHGASVILRGIDEKKDSVYIVLKRYKAPYALSRSALQAGTY